MRNVKLVSLILGAVSSLLCSSAVAQKDYPNKSVRVIVPYPPGGITDVVTRTVALELAKTLGQSFVVDNRPGANSILGVDLMSKAAPDGYTLGTVIAAHAANQTLYAKLPYDSIKSFEHVSLLATAPLILCASNSLPVNTAKELVDLAKAKPVVDKLSREAAAAVRRSEIRERFVQLGIEPVGNTSAEFAQFLRVEVEKWAKVIKDANVKIDN